MSFLPNRFAARRAAFVDYLQTLLARSCATAGGASGGDSAAALPAGTHRVSADELERARRRGLEEGLRDAAAAAGGSASWEMLLERLGELRLGARARLAEEKAPEARARLAGVVQALSDAAQVAERSVDR